MRYMIGVDVGGTFTDLTLVDVETQTAHIHKVLSTPSDPSQAIMSGLSTLLAREKVDYSLVDYLAHGTTVATNALIEHKGARTGLLITEGFRDLLEIGRQMRPALYDLHREKPVPLVPGQLRKEVEERIYADGTVRKPLDVTAARKTIAELREAGVESVAVCFLFSYLNPAHERAVVEAIQQIFPEAFVSASHEIVPEFREFPRLSTTVLNAYLGPIMKRYLENFQSAVSKAGIETSPFVTQSNGGILSIRETVHAPVRTALSGPSAGVVAAAYIGKLAGYDNLITLDMGGTSADISLIYRGEPLLSVERSIEGWPSRIPMLDIVTIGAGGGSIAWVDEGGALKVGPHSAGANPGPACYGFGGVEATMTDANVVLGRMNPQRILGGRMQVDRHAAETAISTTVCDWTGLSLIDAASGIVDVVNANMVRATRLVSVERGYDPRDFTLMAFGGAGPLHAVAVAQELGIPWVLVPPSPGTLCSLGLLVTDIRTDHVRSLSLVPNAQCLPQIVALFEELDVEGQRVLDQEGVPDDKRRFTRWIDARYQRQNYELAVPVSVDELSEERLPDLIARFHAEHARLYDYARPEAPVEFVNYRLTATGELPKAPIPRIDSRGDSGPSLVATREAFFKEVGGFVPCPLYDRSQLAAGDRLVGPLIIEQMDSTTVVPPGLACSVDAFGNLLIAVSGSRDDQ
jgi:N-methylhydantoinase A